jgi:EmrB/QacA subfamily drug resistance transporter
VEYVDWRWIFFINVPVSILATFAAVAILPKFPPSGRSRFDTIGFVAIATGFFALLLALSEGESWGWTSFPVVTLICVAIIALSLFVVWELGVDQPLLDLHVFRSWEYVNSLMIISVLSIGMFTVLFYIPVFLQAAQGLGAFESGFVLLPQALVMAVMMPLAGRIYDRIGPRWPALVGLLICTWGTFLLHDLTPDTPRHTIALYLMFRASGMGLAMMPIMTAGLAAIPPAIVPSGSAFNNVVQRVSAGLGLAILGAILTTANAQFLADRAGLAADGTPIPSLGPGETGRLLGGYVAYNQIANDSFVDALDNVMIITMFVTAVGFVLALFLRSGAKDHSEDGHTVLVD